MRTTTLLAASAAILGSVQAASVPQMGYNLRRDGWTDQSSKPVDGGDAGPSKPVLGGEGKPTPPVGGPSKPVDGGESKPTPPVGGPSKPVEGGEGKPTPPVGGPSKPVDGGEGKPTPPVGGPSKPVDGGHGKPTTTTTTTVATTTSVYYWGDNEIPSEDPSKPVGGGHGKPTTTTTTTTTTEAPHTWEDVPSVETTTTTADPHTWADVEEPSKPVDGGFGGKPSKPVIGGQGEPSKPVIGGQGEPTPAPHTWADVPSEDEETVTITKTGTITVTKYIEGEAPATHTWEDAEVPASSTTDPAHTWEDVPSVETTTSAHTWEDAEVPASSTAATSTWADWASKVPAGEGVDECIITIITKYGKPTWNPTPAAETPAVNTWADVPSVESEDPHTWEDVPSVETTTTPVAEHTWADVPSVETTTSADPHTWEDVPSVETTTTTPVAEHTWADVPSVETTTSADPHTWEDVPSVETTTTADPHTWEDVPSVSTTTTTTPVAVHTWADASVSTGGAFYPAPSGGSGSGKPSGDLGSSEGKWAVTYSPYADDGGCASKETIYADIEEIKAKGFTAVRVYSTDCKTLEYVGGAAKQFGIKLILGIFLKEDGVTGGQKQVEEIKTWAQWDLVELVVAGNEAVFNKKISASDLKAFIISVKKEFSGAGYSGPVTTTETLDEWLQDGASWCDAVDVVAANLYAFFNPTVTADKAGDFVTRQMKDLEQICPGKPVYIMETGWPSQGAANGAAVPSIDNQKTAIESIKAAVAGKNAVYHTWKNDVWKKDQPDVEKSFGIKDCF